MASKSKAKDKASSAVEGARPYVQRLIEDEELRDNLREAYEAGRDAYTRASGAKKPSALLDDKRLQDDLKSASESLRAVSEALREPEKMPKSGGHPILKLLLVESRQGGIDLRKIHEFGQELVQLHRLPVAADFAVVECDVQRLLALQR